MQAPFFYEPSLVQEPQLFTVSEETSRHAVQVLRMKEGEGIALTNGQGLLAEATIVSADKRRMVVQTLRGSLEARPATDITLAISFVKNPARIEWMLEKITEIGVGEIIPMMCQRTERAPHKAARWQQILISAMLQSRQTWLPALREPTPFAAILSGFTAATGNNMGFIAHCMEGTRSLQHYGPLPSKRTVLIGPEGDFTPAEVTNALEAGFLPLGLGDTRLRTETAGLVAVTLLQHH